MKAADAARLMASPTGHIVEPALKACERTDVLQAHAALRCLLQCRDNVTFPEHSVSRCVITLDEAEGRLQVRRRKSYRGRGNRAGGKKFIGNQNRAAIQLGEVPGIEQPFLEVALEPFIRENPLAIDL